MFNLLRYIRLLPLTAILLAAIPGNLCSMDVKYGGFAFIGNYKDIPVNFPESYKLMTETLDAAKRSVFDKKFFEFFKDNHKAIKSFNLILDGEGAAKTKTAMAVALTREDISLEDIGGIYKLVFNISCSVVFLDFGNMTLLASYPVFLEFVHAAKRRPTNREVSEILSKLFFSRDFSIQSLILQRMNSYNPRSTLGPTIGVSEIIVEQEALKNISKKYRNNIEAFKSIVAQRFSDSLSSKLGIPVVPYARDYLSARMSLSFADARTQNFTIPPSSYSVDFTLRKLVREDYKQTDAQKGYLYGAYATVKIYDKELKTVYWDKKLKHGEVKTVPKSQGYVADSEIYNEMTGLIIDKYMGEIKDDKKLYREVIKKCLND